MTVKELKEKLNTYPEDLKIYTYDYEYGQHFPLDHVILTRYVCEHANYPMGLPSCPKCSPNDILEVK